MNKIIYFILIIFIFVKYNSSSQDTTASNWTTIGSAGLNISNVSLVNWAGGGNPAVSLSGLFNYSANYQKDGLNFSANVDLGYGMTSVNDGPFRKSDDRIILVSKASYFAAQNLEYSFLADFRTQFNKGYKYDQKDINGVLFDEFISDFLSPGYLNLGLGMTYKPEEYLHIQLSPIANRLIIVLDDSLSAIGAYGVDIGKNIKSELGASLNIFFKKDVFENVNYQSRLNLFNPWADFPNSVVTWENLISMKVNSWLSVNIAADLIYDDKISITRNDGTKGRDTQFRNVIAIGILFKF